MKIIIKNKDWKILKTIDSQVWKTLLTQIKDSWVDIHYACMTWICAACMCSIEKWEKFIDKSFRNEPWFFLWDDEVMTCIAWVKKEYNDLNEEIILKTIY